MKTDHQIIHVDMDAFFASVECLDDPSLKGKPVVVGGDPKKRGVVAAASYEARKYGVHSAMPMAKALRACPDAIVLGVRMKRYVEVSKKIHEIFARYTPQIEPISLDEAFLDVTASLRLFGSAERIGREIKKAIKEELGLIASVGIAPNKFLAKLASDLEKPDGFVIVTKDRAKEILDPLNISKIWGIGKVTQKELAAIGIRTIGQLRQTHVEHLRSVLGNQTSRILELANGIDNRAVEAERVAKSISSEQTFAKDIKEKQLLADVLLNQVEEVAHKLRANMFEAKTITLKFRDGNFNTVTRSKTFTKATNVTETLWREAKAVFDGWYKKSGCALRLLGFGASGLRAEGSGQKELFADADEEKHKRIDKAYDKIKSRYGDDAVKRGR